MDDLRQLRPADCKGEVHRRAALAQDDKCALAQTLSYRTSAAAGRSLLSDGEGVVVMFFLMRYQSAVASSREVSFARQLFRISFFM